MTYKFTLILAFLLTLGGCGVSSETKNQLGNAAGACIVSASKILDDGISPADTVAYGVMSRCQRQIDAYDEARLPPGRGFNTFANAAWDNRNAGWIKQITAVVLQERAIKRSR